MYLKYSGLFDRFRNIYFEKILHKYATSTTVLLDYGCGPGDMLSVCLKNNIKAFGIDNSVRSVNLAKEKGIHAVLGDVKEVENLPTQKFDIIFLQSVIEHVPDSVGLLKSLKKYLKSDGLFILSAPTPSLSFWDDPTHIRPYTPKSYDTIAQLINCNNIYISYVSTFILNIRFAHPILYRIMGFLGLNWGTNMVCILKNREHEASF